MLSSRFALAVAAVGLSFVVVHAESDLRDLHAEEECPADGSGGEECALSLRQLRAKGVDASATAVSATDAAAEEEEASAAPAPSPAFVGVPAPPVNQSLLVPPIPGGWGEAADYAHEIDPAGVINESLTAQWGWAPAPSWTPSAPAPSWTPSSGRRRSSGSCASYGCINYYASGHSCQCNSACVAHGSCCSDYNSVCRKAPSSNVMTLYHQTSQHAANLIKASGFKPGSKGWCGGAIYFAKSKRATYTKAIGPDSHKGAMLECKVDVGKVMFLDKRCDGSPHNEYNLQKKGYGSVSFNPGDGAEYILWDASKVLSIKQVPKY